MVINWQASLEFGANVLTIEDIFTRVTRMVDTNPDWNVAQVPQRTQSSYRVSSRDSDHPYPRRKWLAGLSLPVCAEHTSPSL